ncbi:MAG TPA: DNA polymerase ligase N-terminal domain-containing protein [Thermoanaerobaculia bacterium]|nr:DNA polymerase ligase N-terminal domain-containing protein [Thermoanaerobaculia bacterium]
MPKQLAKYQAMRDFGVTPEPKGAARPRKDKRPIFVVQKHAASHLHYDFRLEIDGVLKSWAVPKGPSYDPGTKRLAMMTEDHPYEYAKFEGVIPAGNYGAGNVIIWDQGTWEFIGPAADASKAVREGQVKFRLDGVKLKGEWALIHLKGRSRKENEWLLVKHRDGWATTELDVTEYAPQSVVSGKTVEDVGGEAVWVSNRKASRVRTVADRVRSSKKAAPKKKAASTKAAAKKSAPRAKARLASKK